MEVDSSPLVRRVTSSSAIFYKSLRRHRGWNSKNGRRHMVSSSEPGYTCLKNECIVGDVVLLRLPIQTTLILSSTNSAFDLLDKRSNIYSDRPRSVMEELSDYYLVVWTHLADMHHFDRTSWDFSFAFMPYTVRWRRHRRYLHQYFHQGVIHNYQDVQRHAVRSFLKRMLNNPGDVGPEVRK